MDTQHHRQHGQAMPLVIGFAAIITLGALMMFNNSVGGIERVRASSAADAAVYSGAVWQARMLNAQAYTNKGMIANQVAIAQLVSIRNWVQYLDETAFNLDAIANIVFPLKPITAPLRSFTLATSTFTDNAVPPLITLSDLVIDVLEDSQLAMHSSGALGAGAIVRNVLKENDSRYQITPLGLGWIAENTNDWNGFTTRYNSLSAMTRKKTVIEQSQDPFSDNRSWTWKVPPGLLPLDLAILEPKIEKHGETRLFMAVDQGADPNDDSDNEYRWQWRARDTMSYHQRYFKGWRLRGHRETIPIGWYQSTLDSDSDKKVTADQYQRWGVNHRIGEWMAIFNTDEADGSYGGVRPYRDIASLDPTEKDGRDPRLQIAIEIVMPESSVRTTSHLQIGSDKAPDPATRNGIGTDVFGLDDEFSKPAAGDTGIAAVAAAEVFFRRPTQRRSGHFGAQDNQDEFASLFNPYWDVRLIDASTQRQLAWLNRGIPNLPAGGINP
jgi:hypothetical protein